MDGRNDFLFFPEQILLKKGPTPSEKKSKKINEIFQTNLKEYKKSKK